MTPGYHHRQFTSFALHYDGTGWTQVAVPNNSGLFDVYALSRNNAWAVAGDGSVLRWDGSAWTVLTQVYGGKVVAALSPTDVWVAGVVSIGHYGGSGWTTDPGPERLRRSERWRRRGRTRPHLVRWHGLPVERRRGAGRPEHEQRLTDMHAPGWWSRHPGRARSAFDHRAARVTD